ncbi:hypothetical protein E5676_scaffold632G00090 [Cucumis melo var. makuwa]|uniref:Uncharacterized protein n=1 Tax=Cucumis melo var. makuwa TaxID=1194695 RepID=A0A5D3CB69_CUCMM|nr:hypothetical protein E5676_scaffold632G00090 [Cucumis melo var. makuwa]
MISSQTWMKREKRNLRSQSTLRPETAARPEVPLESAERKEEGRLKLKRGQVLAKEVTVFLPLEVRSVDEEEELQYARPEVQFSVDLAFEKLGSGNDLSSVAVVEVVLAASPGRYLNKIFSEDRLGERKKIEPQEISARIQALFRCKAIVIAQEKDQDGERDHHVGVLKENAHRKNDFSGANDFYDIWAIDEFTDDSEKFESEQGINPNTLLILLDGQEARLDAKYEKRLIKKDNVPIVMIGNKLAHQKGREPSRQESHTTQGKNGRKSKRDKWQRQKVIVMETALKGRKMNLLKFAVVPISKYRGKAQEQIKKDEESTIFITLYEDESEYTTWPLILRRQQGKDISLALDVYTERFCHAAKQTLFYELPQLVKQAKASEKQTSGELFLGHAHEHDL